MFILRDAVIQALDAAALDQFVHRLSKFLRETLPEPTRRYDDASLTAYIHSTRDHAAAYGIRSEYGVASFVCIRLLVGDIRGVPEVHAFLSEPSEVSPDERAGLLLRTSCQNALASTNAPTGGE